MSYIAFDLEISKSVPEGGDWSSYRPFGISCAATWVQPDDELRLWHGDIEENGMYASYMSPAQCQELACFLVDAWMGHYQVVTWNGLGFDFDVLAEECQDPAYADVLRAIALHHVDVAFAMFCQLGYMCSLDNAAAGMKIPGKLENVSGKMAPEMWAADLKRQSKVLAYVAQDAKVTANVHDEIVANGFLRWITRRGTPCKSPWYPPHGQILTVSEALELPEPNVSWMDDPWERGKFSDWATIE